MDNLEQHVVGFKDRARPFVVLFAPVKPFELIAVGRNTHSVEVNAHYIAGIC